MGNNKAELELEKINTNSMKELKIQLYKEHRQLNRQRLLKNQRIITGGILTAAVIILAAAAPFLFPQGPHVMEVADRLKPPSAGHLLGTDSVGRDLLCRLVYGARVSVGVGAAVAVITMAAGMIMGLYAGYYKAVDQIVMRICDSLKAIPSILLAIALLAIMGSGTGNVIISVSIVYAPDVARIARAAVLSAREQTYIEALEAAGAGANRILWLNIAPNILSSVIIQVSFIFATAIVTEASLSFLGVGVPVPEPSWGNIVYEGKTVMFQAWWLVAYPSLFIAATVLGLNLLGDGLRDFLDPQNS
ncbi:MAG: ABC transporter permease [Lachnoclostridium edouardi]|uniref:ABC transporter permease n=1 Tax=Lachnoclostridium edouardi TaxID=1926283 RepID=UPI0026DD664F|nr:ABC transporter permease [Lachnoclostridium edouardi]MDO4279753.1 ABC transporter permease [Lachnoclostridium edouardi]